MFCFLDYDILRCRGWFIVSEQSLESLDDFGIYVQWWKSFLCVNEDCVKKADESLLLALFINLAGDFFKNYFFNLNVSIFSYEDLILFVKKLVDSVDRREVLNYIYEEDLFFEHEGVVELSCVESERANLCVEGFFYFDSVNSSRIIFRFSEVNVCV